MPKTNGWIKVNSVFTQFKEVSAGIGYSHAKIAYADIIFPDQSNSVTTSTTPHEASLIDPTTMTIILRDSNGDLIDEYEVQNVTITSDKEIKILSLEKISSGEFEAIIIGLEEGEHTISVEVLGNMAGSAQVNFTALSSPFLYSWGSNNEALMASDEITFGGSSDIQEFPTLVEGLGSVTKIAVAEDENAIAISNGKLVAWGTDEHGITGIDTSDSNSLTILPKLIDDGVPNAWVDIAISEETAFGIKEDGTLWSWGTNDYGLLGINDTDQTRKEISPIQIGTDSDWISVSGAEDHAAALKSNGTVYTWGYNAQGRTGLGVDNFVGTLVPTQEVTGITDAVQLYTGNDFTFVLRANGEVYGCGDRSDYPIGDGGSSSGDELVLTRVAPQIDKKWILMSGNSSDAHFLLSANNEIYGWGDNDQNGLGKGAVGITQVPEKISGNGWYLLGGTGYGEHMLALRQEQDRDFSLWAWGENTNGCLGIGESQPDQDAPIQVGTDTDWVGVAVGDDVSFATKGTIAIPETPDSSQSSYTIDVNNTIAANDIPAEITFTLLDVLGNPIDDIQAFDFSFNFTNGSGNITVERISVNFNGEHTFAFLEDATFGGTVSIEASVLGTVIFPNIDITFEPSRPLTLEIDTNKLTGTQMQFNLDIANLDSIDWGDGTVDSFADHTYASDGVYTVLISGKINYFNGALTNPSRAEAVIKCLDFGTSPNLTSLQDAFRDAENLIEVPTTLSSTVTTTRSMFNGASSLNQNLSNWDTSNVTEMNFMFFGASSFNGDITTWDTSSVNTMKSMFNGASDFNQNLSNWNTSSVIDMEFMFKDASSFNGDVTTWDTSSVTTIRRMFLSATSFNQNINSWDVSSVIDMNSVFNSATSFDQPLDNWDVSNVEDFSYMFGDTPFNQNINSWNTSSAVNMQGMFSVFFTSSNFNQPLNNWDTSNVTDMSFMFYYASSFNQDLSSWCVEQISSEPAGFDDNATAWTLPRPNWGDPCP